jgi:hypothetical protein
MDDAPDNRSGKTPALAKGTGAYAEFEQARTATRKSTAHGKLEGAMAAFPQPSVCQQRGGFLSSFSREGSAVHIPTTPPRHASLAISMNATHCVAVPGPDTLWMV